MRLKLVLIAVLLAVGGTAIFLAFGGLPRNAAAATTYLTGTAQVADVNDDVAATGSIALVDHLEPRLRRRPDDGRRERRGSGEPGRDVDRLGGRREGRRRRRRRTRSLRRRPTPTLAADDRRGEERLDGRRAPAAARRRTLRQRGRGEEHLGDSPDPESPSSTLGTASRPPTQKLTDLQATAARNPLVAPAAGIVTAVNVTAGADAPSGAAIRSPSTDYQVTAEVVESDIATMRLQQPAPVAVVRDRRASLDGTVTAIAPSAIDRVVRAASCRTR